MPPEKPRRYWLSDQGLSSKPDSTAFTYEVKRSRLWPWTKNIIPHKTAIFRQVNLANPNAHHDALEFPNGDIVLLTYLMEGQEATVLQLPATGSKAPQRAAYV